MITAASDSQVVINNLVRCIAALHCFAVMRSGGG